MQTIGVCDVCGQDLKVCSCDFKSILSNLDTINQNPVKCSVCDTNLPDKYGVCASCLQQYGISGTEEPVAEVVANETTLNEVITEEMEEDFTEVPDLEFDDNPDDFDVEGLEDWDDFEKDLEDDDSDWN